MLDAQGRTRCATPLVEIWQCDANGVYLHTGSGNADKRDRNFQGFGRFLTGSTGEYYFRTIKPVPYPGRTPHIHFKVKHKGQGDCSPRSATSRATRKTSATACSAASKDAKARDLLMVDFAPIKESKVGELAAKFDIVLGFTPEA